MLNLVGKSLGRYQILERLGEGGMAIVYKAYDTRLEKDVAVKVIRTENLAPSILERSLKRFEREAKSLAKLTHANIVNILDYGEYEGKPYLVMPYLQGGTLKQKLQGKPIQYQEAAKLLIPIAKALAYAHQQGMVHRDVKPANILITHSGDPMLTDFGIAKIIDDEATMDLTGTSAAIGTPEYMAPEQITSKTADHRADIYSLGVVFYEMVTGRKPYIADTPMAVLFKHASEPLPRPKKFVSSIPDEVEQILIKALAKKPQDRYYDALVFANAMEYALTNAGGRNVISPLKKTTPADPYATATLSTIERTSTAAPKRQTIPNTKDKNPYSKLLWGMGGMGICIGLGLILLVISLYRGNLPTMEKPGQTPAAISTPTDILSLPPTDIPTLVPTSISSPTSQIIPPATIPQIVSTATPNKIVAKIKYQNTKLRTGPDIRFKSVGDLKTGDECELIARYRSWFQALCATGGTGWLAVEWLEISSDANLNILREMTSSELLKFTPECKKYSC